MAAQLYKFSKTHQTTCLNAQMLWYVNHTSIIMLKEKKASHRMGENIYKWSDWQGIHLQNKQSPSATQYQKNKQLSQKMGRRFK